MPRHRNRKYGDIDGCLALGYGRTDFEDFAKFPDESWVVCAHIMDAPAGIPREEQEDVVRALPGSTGVLRIGEFFEGLKNMAIQGRSLQSLS